MTEQGGAQGGAAGELVLYTSDDGLAYVQLRALNGTAWLSLNQMAELFGRDKSVISRHIANIFEDGEIDSAAVVAEFATTAADGKKYQVAYYNLDLILAVGYRVRSARGVQFRRWATTVLSEYLVKGFAMDDAKLKDAKQWDYFDEWLQRIRDIRASEKRFYQKVRDLYATAVDYDAKSDASQTFFAKVQNKMLWAVTGMTAGELFKARGDSEVQNMGLTSWAGAIVRKGDVAIGKNYLSSEEAEQLNRIVTMYLDYAEDQATRRQSMSMADWADKLDAFLKFNERELLMHSGKVSAAVAKKLAEERYGDFDTKRKAVEATAADDADFAAIERLANEGKKTRGTNQ
ncbi:virulence RhuM family protein [Arthrobacter sp. CG_A4]|uniref:virulence RhuM family protein n=1 Tax=Arthrobacter sp. CG_A4 TaxID=3071706 RepID=UPI002E049E9C|nr:hypothetical protein [Arthrobacter sp. CG_A4]